MDRTDLKTLIVRAQAGNLKAYGELVRRFQNMAYGYAYSILGDFHLAEDVAQEAFTEAYQKLADLQTPRAFSGWFRRIVFKYCDRLRRGKTLEMVSLDAALDMASKTPGPDELTERREVRTQVIDMIRSLPEKEREVTTLYYMNELSQKEVAAFLEVPVTTVKNRLYASRARLKQRMLNMVNESLNAFPLPERFADVIVQMQFVRQHITPLAGRMGALSDALLLDKNAELRRRLAGGEDRESIKAEAFALVREASRRALNSGQYDVQLVAALILDEGWVAEIASGEGKSLACYPALYMAVLSGKHVHVVTENDYLARRDAATAGKVFSLLGVTVGAVSGGAEDKMDPEARHAAYRCDVTYGAWAAFGYDCLRDRLREPGTAPVQGRLDVAIIDEIDRLLIDQGRTPLVISEPASVDPESYRAADRIARDLIARNEAAGADPLYEMDPKSKWTLLFTQKGIETCRQLTGNGDRDLHTPILQALRAHLLYQKDREYVLQNDRVVILDAQTGRPSPGRAWSEGLHQAMEVKEGVALTPETRTTARILAQDYFRQYEKRAGMGGTARTQMAEFRKRFGLEVATVPTRRPCNRIDHEDRVYPTAGMRNAAVAEEVAHYSGELGRPVLLGTPTIDLSETLSQLLTEAGIDHQVLNARTENAVREAEIVAEAGTPGRVTIATEMAGRGTDIRLGNGTVNPTCRMPSVEDLEKMGVQPDALFPSGSVKCCIGCTEYDAATNCARCYKSKLDSAFPNRGRTACRLEPPCGLHVIGARRHPMRRIDDQLTARAGRQGEPGSSRFFLSRDEPLLMLANLELKPEEDALLETESVVENGRISSAIARVQAEAEKKDFGIRQKLDGTKGQ